MAELIPMEDPINDPVPNTFVTFEFADGRKLVGTFKGWIKDDLLGPTMELQAPNGAMIYEPAYRIVAGWWAPMGYRPDGGNES